MESLPSEFNGDLNDTEMNLIFKKVLENATGILSRKEYHTLENVNNPSCVVDTLPENDERTTDFQNDVEESSIVVEHGFEDNVELQLSDITSIMTRFNSDDSKNNRILQLSKQIQGNIAECCILTNQAKTIIAEKMHLQRKLDALNEKIACLTMEDKKYQRILTKKGRECAKTGSHRPTYFSRFGCPYFKTKDRFPAEQNEDLRAIIRSREVMVIRMPPVRRILKRDTRTLDACILNQLRSKRIQQLESKLKQLERPENGNVEFDQQTQNLLKAIEHARNVSNIRDTKDWDIEVDFFALSQLNPRFSVEDYERMWELVGHPKLSREQFTKDELARLKELARVHRGQDWDEIARQLGTQHSGFVCFNKWVSLEKKGSRQPWTKEEDDLLFKLCSQLEAIHDKASRNHHWRYIRRQFPSRTYAQIHAHWKYKLAPTLVKGRFTEAESELLESLIREGKSFGEIASIIQTRSSVQLRSHYNQIVERASSNTGSWTLDEELALCELIDQYGTNNWVQISKELGTRNRSQCRLKYIQGMWTPSETQLLQELVQKYGLNYEKISEEIGTKSVTQCRIKIKSQKDSQRQGSHNEGRWTKKETALFRSLFEKYQDNFTLISQELKTRTVEQCQEKYERMTHHSVKYPIKKIDVKVLDGECEDRVLNIYRTETELTAVKRNPRWTITETSRFKKLLQDHGDRFDEISRLMGTKSIKQCRNMFARMKQKNEESSDETAKKCDREVTRKRKQPPAELPEGGSQGPAVNDEDGYQADFEDTTLLRCEDPLKESPEKKKPAVKKARTRKRACPSKKVVLSTSQELGSNTSSNTSS